MMAARVSGFDCRYAMTAPRPQVKSVEQLELRVGRAAEDLDSCPLCLPDVASMHGAEPVVHRTRIAGEGERVTDGDGSRRQRWGDR